MHRMIKQIIRFIRPCYWPKGDRFNPNLIALSCGSIWVQSGRIVLLQSVILYSRHRMKSLSVTDGTVLVVRLI